MFWWRIGGALCAVLAILCLAFVGPWLVLALAALAAAAFGVHRGLPRPQQIMPSTLDDRYADSAALAEHWLAKWTQLRTKRTEYADLAADEAALLDEALAGAAEASGDAVRRCQDLGAEYVANALERLRYIADIQVRDPSIDWQYQWRRALDAVERYLEELWLEPQFVKRMHIELDECRRAQRRVELADLVSSVALLDPFRESRRVLQPDDDLVDSHLHRLRAERRFLAGDPFRDSA